MTSLTSMHHPTYYQVMLEQGAQIDIVNQQPTRISTSSLSFQEPLLIGTGYQKQLHQPIPSRASVCSRVPAKLHTSHTRYMSFCI